MGIKPIACLCATVKYSFDQPWLTNQENNLAESLPVLATECRIVLWVNPITLFLPKEVFID